MKILICGEYGVFCKELISRMKKEGYDVFVITGSEKPRRKKPKSGVFQDYNFSYRSKSIGTVMKNIKADVMIILGTCDVKYTWEDEKKESVRYLSGMINLLLNAKQAGVPEVIYCSSLGDSEDSEMEKTYRQVETVCTQQSEAGKCAITTIHFPEIYGEIRTKRPDICAELVEEVWEKDEIVIHGNRPHRILYVKDAADAVMRVFSSKSQERRHLAEGSVHTEEEIISAVKDVIGDRNVMITDIPVQEKNLTEAKEPEKSTMGFLEKYSLRDGLNEYYKLFIKERNASLYKKEERGSIRKSLIPFAENAALFLIVTLFTYLLRSTWVGENVNLYLFYMIIIATVYGCNQTMAAAFFMIAERVAAFFWQSSEFTYTAFADVLQVLIAGVFVGYMHDRYKRRLENLEDEKKYFQSELLDMTRIYDGSRYIKEVYEQRLMGYKMSMPKVYELTSALDFWEPQKVVFQAVDVARELLEIEDAAIYIAGKEETYLRLTASSSELARSLGGSLCVDNDFFMRDELLERTVFCNKEMKPELPTYACGIYAEEKLIAIMMLWTQDLSKVNLYESNTLAVLGKLIGSSLGRARTIWNGYMNPYIHNTNILKEESFDNIFALCREGKEQNKVIYSLLKIPQEEVDVKTELLFGNINRLVRETDYVGQKKDGLYIILLNASKEEADFVESRFKEAEIKVENLGDRG